MKSKNRRFFGPENPKGFLKLKIIVSMIGILMLPMVLGLIQYQETADSISISSGSWIDYSNIFDGDWNTYGKGGPTGVLDITYYKPSDAIEAIWRLKDGDGIITNLTLPSDCWSHYLDRIRFQVTSAGFTGAYWDCYNGAWQRIRNGPGGKEIYEEGIYWDIPTKEEIKEEEKTEKEEEKQEDKNTKEEEKDQKKEDKGK
ncbi:hypothetical protein KY348_00050 [Candidatus Woesearchaeota archaeon]|nr:hypothetical protein [Candidatus Woesearchaeota archaeon]